MDSELLAHQARAAVDTLTAQLRSLENEQTALLHSLQLTSTTLSTLPAYNTIAPTLSQIPVYESKLARLKNAMATQAREVDDLKRRAREANERRRRNLKRIEETRRGERERDRTVLKAQARIVEGEENTNNKDDGEVSPEAGEIKRGATPVGGAPSRDGVVKTVKRKKKARQAEIQ
ncbi:hypothetical protein L873DRAFT_1689367 [Choiromyces venosus 120613-1]|uniref:Uncharacterized protein n=1 Tax=Choiromyces venosus 120613-1 TaxID=1336337 RepID=A0A3N4JM99_9PEZI|nr:hypothetical protein L873DRAFT_1689367 [Choiromyces venosus 120613-1]